MNKKELIAVCKEQTNYTEATNRAVLNLFCEILGYPKNELNYFIGNDPYGIVCIQEDYRYFNMTDIHVVISEYERWLKLYGSNEKIRKQVDAWYFYCQEWNEKHYKEEPKWVSVEERLPEHHSKDVSWTNDVMVIDTRGHMYKSFYDYDYRCWYDSKQNDYEDPLVCITHWKPIITPEQEAECGKGCPNLRSWLAGCPVEGLREATSDWKKEQRKSLEEAHRRTEEAKQALYKAIEEEAKLNKF